MTERRKQLSLTTIINHYTHWFGQFHQTLFFKTSFFSGKLSLPGPLEDIKGFEKFAQYQKLPAFVTLAKLHASLTEQAIALYQNRRMFGQPDLKRYACLWASYEKLIAQLQKIEKNIPALESGSLDPLTGLKIPEELITTLERELGKACHSGGSCIIALIDVDYISRINEIHSRDAGDFILSEIAGRVAQDLRPYDEIFRLQEDKFFLLLKQVGPANATGVLQRIQRKISILPVTLPDARDLTVSVSIGATLPQEGLLAEEVLSSARRALALAKEARKTHTGTALAFYPEIAADGGHDDVM